MISGKIDVTKISKERLFKGTKGIYLDVTLIETKNDQYGNDYFIVQNITKEERDSGKKAPIIGNAKILGGNRSQPEGGGAQQKPNSGVPW